MIDNHIMIVEDNALIGIVLKMELTKAGYNVIGPVATGEKAIEEFNKCNPMLILLDIQLAGQMNGLEAAEIILKTKSVKIILTTAYTTDEYIKIAADLKITDILEKPINFYYLIEHIKELAKTN